MHRLGHSVYGCDDDDEHDDDLDTEDNELEELEERAEARKKTTEKQV